VGFDPLASRTGMGVPNMTARAGVLGASFMLTSAPGGGTLVRFSVPSIGRPSRTYGIKALMWSAGSALTRGRSALPSSPALRRPAT
jgi:hypothetical protein